MSKGTYKQLKRRVGRTSRGLTKTKQQLKSNALDLSRQYLFLSQSVAGIGLVQQGMVETLKKLVPDLVDQIKAWVKQAAEEQRKESNAKSVDVATKQASPGQATDSLDSDGVSVPVTAQVVQGT